MFVEEFLADLRAERFTPVASVRYVTRVLGRARDHAVANPGAVRSIWCVALAFFVASFAAAGALALAYDRRLAVEWFLLTALGMLPVFAAVTFSVGALRDRENYPLSAINLPTILTLLRAALVPGIVLLLLKHHLPLAFSAYLLAAITDVADGWLARRWNQTTRLGTVLDPLVDIVFNLALLAGLTAAGLLSGWVLVVAGLRYLILVGGAIVLYVFVGPVKIQPTWFGRLTGVIIAALIGLLLLLHTLGPPFAHALLPLTQVALGILLAATVAHVVALGWYNLKIMTGAVPARGRVVGDVRWGAR
jgi:cardiolipin synthase